MIKNDISFISKFRIESKEEGETIENKVDRVTLDGEAIKDGAPYVYTERKEGVIPAYNIRTDRWDVAMDAMSVVNKSKITKNESWKTINKEDGKPETPVQPTPDISKN